MAVISDSNYRWHNLCHMIIVNAHLFWVDEVLDLLEPVSFGKFQGCLENWLAIWWSQVTTQIFCQN